MVKRAHAQSKGPDLSYLIQRRRYREQFNRNIKREKMYTIIHYNNISTRLLYTYIILLYQ